MIRTGSLKSWNEERGFGFITPSDGTPDIFVHASEFPPDGSSRAVGQALSYEIGRGPDGRLRAMRVFSAGGSLAPEPYKHRARRDRDHRTHASRGRSRLRVGPWPALLVVIGIAIWFGARETGWAPGAATSGESSLSVPGRTGLERQASALVTPTGAAKAGVDQPYACDGRTHCSEMTSCAEARHFLAYCPGVQMDGDHDGRPCEEQWCNRE
jgi:cold shock CspA family protein